MSVMDVAVVLDVTPAGKAPEVMDQAYGATPVPAVSVQVVV